MHVINVESEHPRGTYRSLWKSDVACLSLRSLAIQFNKQSSVTQVTVEKVKGSSAESQSV